ncbi:MAG: MerR family transcriptional regulator [Domibacillus tundrae]
MLGFPSINSPGRHSNGYRLYTPLHLCQILLIRMLRKNVYFLENMKEIVQTVEYHNLKKLRILRKMHC